MGAPSSVFEMQQIEVLNARAGLAAALDPYMTRDWILENIFKFSQDDALYMQKRKRDERGQDTMASAEDQMAAAELAANGAGTEEGEPAEETESIRADARMRDDLRALSREAWATRHLSERVIQRLDAIEPTVQRIHRAVRSK